MLRLPHTPAGARPGAPGRLLRAGRPPSLQAQEPSAALGQGREAAAPLSAGCARRPPQGSCGARVSGRTKAPVLFDYTVSHHSSFTICEVPDNFGLRDSYLVTLEEELEFKLVQSDSTTHTHGCTTAAAGAVAAFLILRIWVVLRSRDFTPRESLSILVVAGSGGHTTEILRLLGSLSNAYSPRHYVIADTDEMSANKINSFELDRADRDPNNMD
ncbi:hypothetical protein H8959_017818 [Pygathrix nigripes]